MTPAESVSIAAPRHDATPPPSIYRTRYGPEWTGPAMIQPDRFTASELREQTRRDLASLARNYGIAGWHGMRKDDLVSEIVKCQRRKTGGKAASTSNSLRAGGKDAAKPAGPKSLTATKTSPTKSAGKTSPTKRSSGKSALNKSSSEKSSPTKSSAKSSKRGRSAIAEMPAPKVDPKTARIRSQLRRRRETMDRHRDLSTSTLVNGAAMGDDKRGKGAASKATASKTTGSKRGASKSAAHTDRIVLMVRDSYWLQANWEITQGSVERAKVAMAEKWHLAQPTLRLLAVGGAENNATESVLRDIAIHGGVDNWYIDVDSPPSRFRVSIGYLVDDEFHSIARSNVVETPPIGQCERLDSHWQDIADDYERVYSLSGGYDDGDDDLREMFESRMHRVMPSRAADGSTIAAPSLLKQTKLPFEVDAELIVFGKTSPGTAVSIAGTPVKANDDGTFTVRMQLPDRRQVLPVLAESQDGLQARTTVISIERNTKVMEPVTKDELFM